MADDEIPLIPTIPEALREAQQLAGLAADASRPAALLLPQIHSVFSVVAPGWSGRLDTHTCAALISRRALSLSRPVLACDLTWVANTVKILRSGNIPMVHTAKIGRNDPCSCGSGKKFKRCCGLTQQGGRGPTMMLVILGVLLAAGLLAGITSFSTDAADTAKTTGVWSPEHGHYH